MFDGPLDTLVRQLASLPGLGGRSARRIALHLLSAKDEKLTPLLKALSEASDAIKTCNTCGNLDSSDPCRICRDPARDKTTLCIVAGVAAYEVVARSRGTLGRAVPDRPGPRRFP